jgi:hypothetical protein
MKPQAAAKIANQIAPRLVAALENSQEKNSYLLSSLAVLLDNPEEADSDQLSSLCQVLAALCALIPSTERTHLLALSNMLLRPVSKEKAGGEEQPYDRKLLAKVCAQLSQQDLTEVLKYPDCTNEAEQIVLNQLKLMTHREFDGNVWKFVAQANDLGIKEVSSPAKRPEAQAALNELGKL